VTGGFGWADGLAVGLDAVQLVGLVILIGVQRHRAVPSQGTAGQDICSSSQADAGMSKQVALKLSAGPKRCRTPDLPYISDFGNSLRAPSRRGRAMLGLI
jgi:hypothetical protein